MQLELKSASYSFCHSVSHVASENFLIHCHPFYELYYFLSGDVRFLYAGAEYPMKPHTMIVVAPHVFHGVKACSDAPYERVTLHFLDEVISPQRRGLLLGGLPTEKTLLSGENPMPAVLPNGQELGLLPLLLEFEALRPLPTGARDALVSVLTENLLARLLVRAGGQAAVHAPIAQVGQGELGQVLAYIHQNLTQKLTLDELSAKFYISKSKLYHLFRQQLGMTVMEYVTRRRVSYAQQLIINGYSAVQAGDAAGFGDYTAFYRAYVKQMGHSPRQDKRPAPADSPTYFRTPVLPGTPGGPGAPAASGPLRPDEGATIWDTTQIINATTPDPGALRDDEPGMEE